MHLYFFFPPRLFFPPFQLCRVFSTIGGVGTRRRDVKGNACKVLLTLSSLEELSFVALSWS